MKKAKATNLNLDEQLVKEAKTQCVKESKTLTSVVEELLRCWLKKGGK